MMVVVQAAEAEAFPEFPVPVGGCDVPGCPGHLGVSHVVAPSS